MHRVNVHRRQLALGLAAMPLAAMADGGRLEQTYIDALKQGRCLVLIRHALTVPGIGDPAGMRLDDCSSQRNLSHDGRAQSHRMGQWFASQRLTPSRIRSSQWCRCLDTAKIAFSRESFGVDVPVEPWTALNSFFQGHGDRDRQIQEAMKAAGAFSTRAAVGTFEVWVTHHVVIGALTGHYPASGEMMVARYADHQKLLAVAASGLIF